jgi:hypothetical protein
LERWRLADDPAMAASPRSKSSWRCISARWSKPDRTLGGDARRPRRCRLTSASSTSRCGKSGRGDMVMSSGTEGSNPASSSGESANSRSQHVAEGTAGPDRLIPPAMQQGKQPFWARRIHAVEIEAPPNRDLIGLSAVDGTGGRADDRQGNGGRPALALAASRHLGR